MIDEKVRVTITQQIIGIDSGEMLNERVLFENEGLTLKQWKGERKLKVGDYMLAVQFKMAELAKDNDFRGDDFRVYFMLMSQLDWEGFLTVNQSEIARETGIQRSSVNRAMRLLTEKRVIIKGRQKSGGLPTYQLNARYGYKGDAAMMPIVAKQQQKRHLKVV